MLIKKTGHGVKSSGAQWIAGTYTATIERVTKLLIVPLDKKGVWNRIQKPTMLLSTHVHTHMHEHTEPHEIVWCHNHMCTQNFSTGGGL